MINNLEVVETFFEVIKEGLGGLVAAGVHGDRVGVDGGSKPCKRRRRQYRKELDWTDEIDLTSAVYEWTLRVVHEWRYMNKTSSSSR